MDDKDHEIEELKARINRLEHGVRGQRIIIGYEYKSRTTIWGWPLIHVVMGYGADPEHPKMVARGIIAVGSIAIGVVALGGIGVGLLSLCGLGLGLVVVAGMAVGGVAVGGVSLGYLALGGVAVAHIAVGGLAIGHYAFGGNAVGIHCASPGHVDPAALDFAGSKLGILGDILSRVFRGYR